MSPLTNPNLVRVVLIIEDRGMPAGSTGQASRALLRDKTVSSVFVLFDTWPAELMVSCARLGELE